MDFYQFSLHLEGGDFEELTDSVPFEVLGKGRWGTQLLGLGERGVPIVRTTTQYQQPGLPFTPAHQQLLSTLQAAFAEQPEWASPPFNNALIEIYDYQYTKMGYHSDQCLDLEKDSIIALFSCYERPEAVDHRVRRTLRVQNKTTEEETVFPLEHHSVVLFSSATNAAYRHKIVLEHQPKPTEATDNRWLGITLRCSKTYLQFQEGIPYLESGAPLTLATSEEAKNFYQLRGQENRSLEFVYPALTYTLSPADLKMPKR